MGDSGGSVFFIPVALLAMCLTGCGGGDDEELNRLVQPSAATFASASRTMAEVDGRIKNVIRLDVLGQYVCAAVRDGASTEKTRRIVRE